MKAYDKLVEKRIVNNRVVVRYWERGGEVAVTAVVKYPFNEPIPLKLYELPNEPFTVWVFVP